MSKHYEDLLSQMEREMERMTQSAFQRFERQHHRSQLWQPRADVCETADEVMVVVEIAGLTSDSINRRIEVTLTTDNRSLVISGRREEPSASSDRLRCYQLEIFFGPFERVIPLPPDVEIQRENLSASYNDGLLIIHLPKRPPHEPRSIPVTPETE